MIPAKLRYGPNLIIEINFVKLARVGEWYEFYTDTGEKYSTSFKNVSEQIKLNSKLIYEVRFDRKSNEWRLIGTKLPN